MGAVSSLASEVGSSDSAGSAPSPLSSMGASSSVSGWLSSSIGSSGESSCGSGLSSTAVSASVVACSMALVTSLRETFSDCMVADSLVVEICWAAVGLTGLWVTAPLGLTLRPLPSLTAIGWPPPGGVKATVDSVTSSCTPWVGSSAI